ncbi:MAG: hypothetical protein R3320_14995, partial [Nitriliruptorales bacterium]|nr:hypothetical protein [Nitriliruptorales bacterium]
SDREAGAVEQRRDLVLLSIDEPVVLVPGHTWEPMGDPTTCEVDPLVVLVDRVVESVQAMPTLTSTFADIWTLERPVQATRWILLAVLWLAAAAGFVPYAVAGLRQAVDLEIDLFGGEVQVAPSGSVDDGGADSDNPSVTDPTDSGIRR